MDKKNLIIKLFKSLRGEKYPKKEINQGKSYTIKKII